MCVYLPALALYYIILSYLCIYMKEYPIYIRQLAHVRKHRHTGVRVRVRVRVRVGNRVRHRIRVTTVRVSLRVRVRQY